MPPKKSSPAPAAASAASSSPPGKARIFLVYGSDDLSATRKADEIVARICPPDEQSFGLETFSPDADAGADSVCAFIRNVVEAILTRPFLGGNKTVYVRGAPFFDPLAEPGKFSSVKAETDRLVDLLKSGIPGETFFVLLTNRVNKTTSFFKTFQKLGEVHAFDEPEKDKDAEIDFVPKIEALLAEKGMSMPGGVLSAFLDRAGYNLRQASSEIEKLSLYLGDRKTVDIEDVYLMVAPVREGKFWEFADAFCGGNLPKTLRVMRRLLGQGEAPVGLVVSLQNRLREVLAMSDCLKRGWARLSGNDRFRKLEWNVPPDGDAILSSLEKDPRKGNPWAVAMMAAQAARFPPGRWFRWLNAAVDAQAAMTGGDAVDPALALEIFTTRALGELAGTRPCSSTR